MADWEDRLVRRDINNNGLLDNDDYYSTDWGSGDFNNGYWKVGKKNDMTNVNKYLGNNSKFNFKNVEELQKFLMSNGYNNLKVDGYAGLQTMNALKDYIDREEKGRQEVHGDGIYADVRKGDKILTKPVTILPAVKPIEPTLYNGGEALTGKYIKSLGIANYNALRDRALNGNDSFSTILRDWAKENKFRWDDPTSQEAIERALNISGRYRGSRVGDYGDMAEILNEFIGRRNGELSKKFPKKESPESIIQEFQAKGPHMSLDNYNAMLQKLTDAGYKNFVPGTTSNPNTLLYNDKPFSNPYLNNLYLNSKTNGSWNRPWSSYLDNSLLNEDNLGEYGNSKRNGYLTYKNGSKLNYMTQKYQAGGAAPQGDPQQQLIQLVQAAMSGDQQASAQIQLIMQAAQQGDQQAAQLAEMIMQIANQMQGGAPQSARNGAKLNYIKRLKGECPEGYEMTYFKAGGKVCKKCQKKVEKACGGKQLAKCGTKFHKAGGVMESILSEMFAKGGAMNRNKHTAFGEERGANVVSTNHAGRWGGRRAFNERGTHNLNPHDKPNKFTAFGDEGKKKPTNVGLVGHKATGKTGRMQNKQKAGTTYKGTAFGGEKQNRFHRGAKASSIGRIGSINGYPKGHGGKSGIGKI